MIMLMKLQTHKLRNSLNTWILMILKGFDTDPLICPKCQHNKCVPLDYKSKRGYHYKYNK